MKVTEALREIMEEKNIRPIDLAKRLGMTKQATNNRLKHKNLSVNVLIDLVRQMGYEVALVPNGSRCKGMIVLEQNIDEDKGADK